MYLYPYFFLGFHVFIFISALCQLSVFIVLVNNNTEIAWRPMLTMKCCCVKIF